MDLDVLEGNTLFYKVDPDFWVFVRRENLIVQLNNTRLVYIIAVFWKGKILGPVVQN